MLLTLRMMQAAGNELPPNVRQQLLAYVAARHLSNSQSRSQLPRASTMFQNEDRRALTVIMTASIVVVGGIIAWFMCGK